MLIVEHLNALIPADGERLLATINHTVETQSPFELDVTVLRPDGMRQIRLRAKVITTATGQVTHIIGTSLDMGEIHSMANPTEQP